MLKLNKVYHGDCLKAVKKMSSNSVDLIILDPPYLVLNVDWDRIEVINVIFVKELLRILKRTGNLYVWCGIGEISQSLIRWFPIFNNLFHFKDLITWKKQRGQGMRRGWLYTREEIMWFVKDNKNFVWNKNLQYSDEKRKWLGLDSVYKSENKRITNVWNDISENLYCMENKFQKDVLHFTPKPIKAIERIIKLHTKKGDIIFDCFAGSGTTAIACENLSRNFILVEKEKAYCILACERIINNRQILENDKNAKKNRRES